MKNTKKYEINGIRTKLSLKELIDAGINAFCQRHNITTETIEIKTLLTLLTSEDYGSKEFRAIFADNQ